MESDKDRDREDSTWDNGMSAESMAALQNKKKEEEKHENQEVEKKWKEIEKDYMRRYPLLRPQDVSYRPNRVDMLIERIAKRTLRTPHEVKVEIQNWQQSLYRRYDR